jgi:hypothetical protein
MDGQYTNGRGFTHNFAYRLRNTVATSPMDDGQVIELNPNAFDVMHNDHLAVQMKSIQVVRHINGLFESVADEVMALVAQGGSL